MQYFSSTAKLGILGGGQLGKMLLYTTRKWDITTHVLDPSQSAPAKLACDHFSQGDFKDYQTVYDFGKHLDVITIEIEHVNTEALRQLEKEGVQVYPSAATLELIQNKGVQKDFYQQNQIPTSKHQRFENTAVLRQALETGKLNYPFVWKAALMGYDGNGVSIIRSKQDIDQLNDQECIAEELVPFTHELAVIVARNAKGEMKTYPVVEMEFHPEANQVEYVLCPARISESIKKKATEIAIKTAEAFSHVGLLAVELFLTEEGEIMVNEVAPRAHNSGHLTIETSLTDQFEQHIRAVLGLPLGSTNATVAGVMVNLVGAEGHTGQVHYNNIEQALSLEGVTPHIYGKKDTRPFRKMGHVTIVNDDINIAREVAEKVKKIITVISN
ncbi:MAG: 5-(carboxyamino)imidazole ribonucleotide synthase [Flavobacteriaceae bacterium]|nr:5-(carboxyamino)imidazole ribonucleotide synthase [Flavobacteriaceae bacterium]